MTARTPGVAPRRRGNDEGSLLLVMLFILMITALILVATGTVISGLAKTRNSRDYAVALQAADSAFADAVMTANMTPSRFGSTAPSPLARPGGPVTVPGSAVTWTWTATRTSSRTWDLRVEAKSTTMSRHFAATLKGTQVTKGILSTSTQTVRYVVDRTEYFEHGFFGADDLSIAGAPDIDGYNGEVGTVGSNATLALGTAMLDHINEWNWTTDSGRCTSAPTGVCPVTNGGSGSAQVTHLRQSATFDSTDITNACATTDGPWSASAGTNLVAGHCYDSLTFDASRAAVGNPGLVYVKGAVTVQAGVTVNLVGNYTNAASSTLRIATLGNFTQNKKSKIAMAVYAPAGACQVYSDSDTLYNTLWLGAATCKTFGISGNARLRYDGGLDLVNDEAAAATGHWTWGVYDYQSID